MTKSRKKTQTDITRVIGQCPLCRTKPSFARAAIANAAFSRIYSDGRFAARRFSLEQSLADNYSRTVSTTMSYWVFCYQTTEWRRKS
jgi:hypothetical protein